MQQLNEDDHAEFTSLIKDAEHYLNLAKDRPTDDDIYAWLDRAVEFIKIAKKIAGDDTPEAAALKFFSNDGGDISNCKNFSSEKLVKCVEHQLIVLKNVANAVN